MVLLGAPSNEPSSPGEFHPQALTEPHVNLSIHRAPASLPLETSQLQADAEKKPGSSQLPG